MRILFVCHRFPYPPTRGGKIRPFNMISHLGKSHQVTVASLARSDEEAEAGSGLASHCHKFMVETIGPAASLRQMLLRAPTPIPSSMGNFYSRRLARRIDDEIASAGFDLILVHCSSVAQYVENVSGIRKIIDFGDMDSAKWLAYSKFEHFPRSLVYRLEWLKLRRAERVLAGKFDMCTCTTRAELETLRRLGVDTPSDWLPNGVDLEFFSPPDEPHKPDTIVFVGRMDYFPNQQGVLDFCANVLPLIRERRPAARLRIVGAEPSREILALGDRPGVAVTGTVPDVRPFVREAAVAIAPLRIARGTQNKILESMAMGVPVVSSAEAAEGIDAVPEEHFLVASSASEFAAAVLRVLGDPVERRRLSLAGRSCVEDRHHWPNSMKKLDRIIAAVSPVTP